MLRVEGRMLRCVEENRLSEKDQPGKEILERYPRVLISGGV